MAGENVTNSPAEILKCDSHGEFGTDAMLSFIDSFVFDSEEVPGKTMLQIADVGDREVYISNCLAFFLNPNESHGLGNLVLASLLESVGLSCVGAEAEVERVQREETTSDRKRLDIVIEGPARVLGIEVKVRHYPNNPWDRYSAHLLGLAGTAKKAYGILLSLRPEPKPAAQIDFIPVTFDKFFEKLEQALNSKNVRGNEPYLGYLRDFSLTLKNIRSQLTMNINMLKALDDEKRMTNAIRLFRRLTEISDDLRRRVKKVAALVREPPTPFTFARYYGSLADKELNSSSIYDSVLYSVISETCISFEIQAFVDRNGWAVGAYPKGAFRDQFVAWMTETFPNSGEDGGYFTIRQFDLDTSEESVAEEVKSVLDAIAKCPPRTTTQIAKIAIPIRASVAH